MSSLIKLGVGLLVLVVLGAGAYYFLGKSGVDKIKEQASSIVNDPQKALNDAKNAAADSVKKISPSVTQAIDLSSGEAKFTLDQEVAINAAYGKLIQLAPGKSVLLIRSYEMEKNETFPSFFFQADTTATSLSGLVGQTVSGKLFIQAAANGAVWSPVDGELVQLKLTGVEESTLVGEISGGKLINDDGKVNEVKGSIRAYGEVELQSS